MPASHSLSLSSAWQSQGLKSNPLFASGPWRMKLWDKAASNKSSQNFSPSLVSTQMMYFIVREPFLLPDLQLNSCLVLKALLSSPSHQLLTSCNSALSAAPFKGKGKRKNLQFLRVRPDPQILTRPNCPAFWWDPARVRSQRLWLTMVVLLLVSPPPQTNCFWSRGLAWFVNNRHPGTSAFTSYLTEALGVLNCCVS